MPVPVSALHKIDRRTSDPSVNGRDGEKIKCPIWCRLQAIFQLYPILHPRAPVSGVTFNHSPGWENIPALALRRLWSGSSLYAEELFPWH
jgi:hypothetical protein